MKKWFFGLTGLALIFVLVYLNLDRSDSLQDEQHSSYEIKDSIKQASFHQKKNNQKKTERATPHRSTANHDVTKKKIKKSKVSIEETIIKNESYAHPLLRFFSEDELSFNQDHYYLSEELSAVPVSGFHGGESIARFAGFVVFERSFDGPAISENEHIRVVFNQSTKRLGLVTGKIFLSLKQNMSPLELRERYHVQFVRDFGRMGLIEVQAMNGHSLSTIEQGLENSDHFHFVEVEIIEGGIFEK